MFPTYIEDNGNDGKRFTSVPSVLVPPLSCVVSSPVVVSSSFACPSLSALVSPDSKKHTSNKSTNKEDVYLQQSVSIKLSNRDLSID